MKMKLHNLAELTIKLMIHEYFAKYWFHNGFVIVNGEKMSKSIGNIKLVHDLINNYQGEVLRLTLLSAHYRQPLNWTREFH